MYVCVCLSEGETERAQGVVWEKNNQVKYSQLHCRDETMENVFGKEKKGIDFKR